MMKTFADFIAEAAAKQKPKAPDYNKVYAAKVAAVRDSQTNYVQAHRDKVKKMLQDREDEKAHNEYVQRIRGEAKAELRKKYKEKYGIDDDDDD